MHGLGDLAECIGSGSDGAGLDSGAWTLTFTQTFIRSLTSSPLSCLLCTLVLYAALIHFKPTEPRLWISPCQQGNRGDHDQVPLPLRPTQSSSERQTDEQSSLTMCLNPLA